MARGFPGELHQQELNHSFIEGLETEHTTVNLLVAVGVRYFQQTTIPIVFIKFHAHSYFITFSFSE